MKWLFLIGLISGGALAEPGDYKLYGCNAEKICEEIHSGNIDEFEAEVPCEVTRDCPVDGGVVKWGTKKQKSLMVKSISAVTGIATGVVKGTVNGLKGMATGAGYTHFEAKLTGPTSSISFSMDMTTGHWGMSNGEGSGGPDPHKNIP